MFTKNKCLPKTFNFVNTDPQCRKKANPVDTRRRFNVYTTSIRRQRRRIDVV